MPPQTATSPAPLSTRFAHLPPTVREQVAQRIQQRVKPASPGALAGGWTAEYRNADTGKAYTPHHDDERLFVYSDTPRNALAKGGEGGGKSTAGVVKDLERLRRGMSGIIGSSDLQHFKKSLWPEFRRWCPVDAIVESQRYRLRPSWEPSQMFTLTFVNGAQLSCGGFDDPTGWEGPNVNFAHWDEARRHKTPAMLKVLAGRVRIPGPNGEPPQLYLTTTPAKHWLFDYFGPLVEDDPLASFKADALVVTLLTSDNEAAGNLSAGFTEQRGQSLTENEKRVLLLAEWEDVDDVDRFLSSIIWWDNCKENLGLLPYGEPIVLVADAAYAVGGDTFGVLGLSRHPIRKAALAVRYVKDYAAKKEPLDFDVIEKDIRQVCKDFNVLAFAYDPYQLHQMGTRLHNERVVKTIPFKQGSERLLADKQLHDFITTRRIAHDGNPLLRQHLDNADRKMSKDENIRIVKRSASLKIDLAVCLSMGVAVASQYLLSRAIPDVTPGILEHTSTWQIQ